MHTRLEEFVCGFRGNVPENHYGYGRYRVPGCNRGGVGLRGGGR